jgi:dethiobiotin synthetase
VETVGGVRSPIAFDGDSVDLCDALEPDLVVLVGDGALGTINSIRLSANALRAHPVLVVLNRWGYGGDVESLNRAWLTDRDGFDVVVSPHAVVERLRGAVGGQR